MAMDHVRGPAKFLHGFQRAFAEEYHALCIIIKKLILVIAENGLALEIIIIIHEVHLQAGIGQRCYFDDQRIIVLIYYYIDAG